MASTIDLLNELLALHRASLPSYFAFAKPHTENDDSKSARLLRLIGEEHFRMTNIIGRAIMRQGGTIEAGDFPMVFTDMHDLSLDYILNEVRQRNLSAIHRINQMVEELQMSPDALAVTQEALGSAKAHAEQLDELVAEASV